MHFSAFYAFQEIPIGTQTETDAALHRNSPHTIPKPL